LVIYFCRSSSAVTAAAGLCATLSVPGGNSSPMPMDPTALCAASPAPSGPAECSSRVPCTTEAAGAVTSLASVTEARSTKRKRCCGFSDVSKSIRLFSLPVWLSCVKRSLATGPNAATEFSPDSHRIVTAGKEQSARSTYTPRWHHTLQVGALRAFSSLNSRRQHHVPSELPQRTRAAPSIFSWMTHRLLCKPSWKPVWTWRLMSSQRLDVRHQVADLGLHELLPGIWTGTVRPKIGSNERFSPSREDPRIGIAGPSRRLHDPAHQVPAR